MKQHPDPIDTHVGARIRARRTALGLSQEKLADSIGITFQQVQKYESGSNRVSSSRLFGIARTLQVPVSFFFSGAEAADGLGKVAEATSDFDAHLSNRETVELVQAYYAIKDETVRKKILDMVKSVATQ